MLQQIGSHARYIQSVLRGTADSASTPDYVKRSWLRCLSQYHLDPQSQREPFVLPREERLARKEANLELVSFAGRPWSKDLLPPEDAVVARD